VVLYTHSLLEANFSIDRQAAGLENLYDRARGVTSAYRIKGAS